MTRPIRFLKEAKRVRADEFHTPSGMIGRELPLHADRFRGRHVVMPCNDGPASGFARFLSAHYAEYGLTGLTGFTYEPTYGTLWPRGAGLRHDWRGGRWETRRLESDGGFESVDVLSLMRRPDALVVSNPPFSRMRRFLELLDLTGVDFLIVMPLTAVTAPAALPHLLDGSWRLGASIQSGGVRFHVPDDYPLVGYDVGRDGHGAYIQVSGVRWLTSLPDTARPLLDVTANRYGPGRFHVYDQLDAIDVPRLKDMPADYPGLMGVPVTVFDHVWHMRPRLELSGVRRDLTVDGRGVFCRVLARIEATP